MSVVDSRAERKVDVAIVGGGPAGLAAALVLGRARKTVLVSAPASAPRRNLRSPGVQGFLGHDGTPPSTLLAHAREELARYPSVRISDAEVASIAGERGAFVITMNGEDLHARRVVLATGILDVLPRIEGLLPIWGRCAFGCPHCHGWEVRDQRLAVLTARPQNLALALLLTGWSDDVMAFTGGQFTVDAAARDKLARQGVTVEERRIRRLMIDSGALAGVEVEGGDTVARDALFVQCPQKHVPLVERMMASSMVRLVQGFVDVDARFTTSTAGIHAVGDMTPGHQQALRASAQGAEVGMMLAEELSSETCQARARGIS